MKRDGSIVKTLRCSALHQRELLDKWNAVAPNGYRLAFVECLDGVKEARESHFWESTQIEREYTLTFVKT